MICGAPATHVGTKPAGTANTAISPQKASPAPAVVDMLSGDLMTGDSAIGAPPAAQSAPNDLWQADFLSTASVQPAAGALGFPANMVSAAGAPGINEATAAGPPAVVQDALFGLDFGTATVEEGSLGNQLRDAVLSGSTDEVRRLFDAASQPKSEATTTAEKLRDAVMAGGSSAEVMKLFQQVQPPQQAQQQQQQAAGAFGSDHFAALRGGPLSPQRPSMQAAPASSLCDLLGGGGAVASSQKTAAPQSAGLGGKLTFSPEELTNLDPRQLVQMQSMIQQALQQRVAQGQPQPQQPQQPQMGLLGGGYGTAAAPQQLSVSQATAAAVADLPKSHPNSPSRATQQNDAALGFKEFGDLLGAFHEKNPIAGLQSNSSSSSTKPGGNALR